MEDPGLVRERAKAILADPNSDQLSRDLAHLTLAEQERTTASSVDAAEEYFNKINQEWIKIEYYERGLSILSDQEAVKLAATSLLVKELKVYNAVIGANGKPSALLAYPKLVRAANTLIDSNTDVADAHVVLGILGRGANPSDGVEHLLRAIQQRPDDWRLRSALSACYMMMDDPKPSLALQSLIMAIEKAPSDRIKFDMETRKAKVLFNLDRREDAKVSFEKVLKDFEKFKDTMTKKDIGHVTVSQYMLCNLYVMDNDKKNAIRHWKQAEAKRNGLSDEVLKLIDWQARTLAQACMGTINSGAHLSHQECQNCRKLVENPRRCSACKVANYCSRECQVAAWKSGHKQECAKLKSEQKVKKQERKENFKRDKGIQNMSPLDATLDPRKMWASTGVKFSKKKISAKEAAFMFLVALFMDFSLDGQDLKLPWIAVNGCDPDDPVALALGMITHMEKNYPLRRSGENMEKLSKSMRDYVPKGGDASESIDEINRTDFGIAMCHIFHARLLGRCYAVTSIQQANSRVHKDAFQNILQLISSAKMFLDYRRWLTFQFELGYSNLDIGAVAEAKVWLEMFLNGLEAVEKKNNGRLSAHWTKMRATARQKCSMLPLLEMSQRSGYGGM